MKKIPYLIILIIVFSACSDDKESGRQLYYLFLDEYNIPAIGRTTIEPQNNTTIANHLSEPHKMAVDQNTGILYITTANLGEIHTIHGNDLAHIDILYDPESQAPTELAIDPSRSRIYWFDRFYGTISTGSLDGKLAATKLFGGKKNVANNCTGMAVDSNRNILYFTDYDASIIYAADLGANTPPIVLVSPDNAEIEKPKNLVISGDGNTLYWSDEQNHIMKTDITSKTSKEFSPSSATSLYMDLRTNSLYTHGGPWIFKMSLADGESPKMTKVFETTDHIIGFVVK